MNGGLTVSEVAGADKAFAEQTGAQLGTYKKSVGVSEAMCGGRLTTRITTQFTNLLGRDGQPEDVAKLVSFLVSDDAALITGERFVAWKVDRGLPVVAAGQSVSCSDFGPGDLASDGSSRSMWLTEGGTLIDRERFTV